MPRTADKLTDQQRRFIAEYVANGCIGSRAAVAAGYAAYRADKTASELLARPHIKAEVERLTAERLNRLEITADKVLMAAARVAFADPRGLFEWGTRIERVPVMRRGQPQLDPATGEPMYREIEVPWVRVKDSAEITEDEAALVQEISNGRDGLKIKLASREAAVNLLAKNLGLLREKVELELSGGLAERMIRAQERLASRGNS